MSRPTLRSLARSLGLSHATVSAALNGRGRVGPATVQHIRMAAEAAGYRLNPLTSAVMSEVRRSRGAMFQAVIAAVEIAEGGRSYRSGLYCREIVRGAAERGAALGFKLETFLAGPGDLPLPRLDSILRARGIRGVVLLPTCGEPDVGWLDGGHYAGVYADYAVDRPALPSVCPDHYRGMMLALNRLRALGYRRPGLYLVPHQGERIQYRWEAAFLAYAANAGGLARAVPRLKSLTLERNEFLQWFREYEPDVVLSHHPEAMTWMAEDRPSGVRPGFLSLNHHLGGDSCTGLDLQPRVIGSLALELVAARLQRAESGSKFDLAAISVCPLWVDGSTAGRNEAAVPRLPPSACGVR